MTQMQKSHQLGEIPSAFIKNSTLRWPLKDGQDVIGSTTRNVEEGCCRQKIKSKGQKQHNLVYGQETLKSVAVESLSHSGLFATPWAAARQACLSFAISPFAQTQVH